MSRTISTMNYGYPVFRPRCVLVNWQILYIYTRMPRDLNNLLMPHPPERWRMMRVSERGLDQIGVLVGDLLVIDVTATPVPRCLVVVTVAGRFRVRQWERTSGTVRLKAGIAGPDFVYMHPREVDLYGVVTSITRRTWPLGKVWRHNRGPMPVSVPHGIRIGSFG
jgi:hypothetical protein